MNVPKPVLLFQTLCIRIMLFVKQNNCNFLTVKMKDQQKLGRILRSYFSAWTKMYLAKVKKKKIDLFLLWAKKKVEFMLRFVFLTLHLMASLIRGPFMNWTSWIYWRLWLQCQHSHFAVKFNSGKAKLKRNCEKWRYSFEMSNCKEFKFSFPSFTK